MSLNPLNLVSGKLEKGFEDQNGTRDVGSKADIKY